MSKRTYITIILLILIAVVVYFFAFDNTQTKHTVSDSALETGQTINTDGVRHNVPLDEIETKLDPDGIPSIDNPMFVPVGTADFLKDNDPGIAVSMNGIDRFYPFQILVWHEIVNDIFGDQRVLVTYCPLCLSGIVFDPLVDGEAVEFGTSGKLWQSNLVMYDRKTNSYWSQVLGEAIVGPMTGAKLEILPSDRMEFGDWKKSFPYGEVLSKKTGAVRFYGHDPYGDYYTSNTYFIADVSNYDNRLENKEYILGLVVNGRAKAYVPSQIKKLGEIEDEFEGRIIVAKYHNKLGVVRLYIRDKEEGLERINPIPSFWFNWVAAHPDTELYE